MVNVQFPPVRVPLVEPATGHATMAFRDWMERMWRRTGGRQDAIAALAFPPGSIIFHGSSTAPSGWLTCDGSAVSRETFSDLFAIIGTVWGEGDASTTFNLPDFQGRTPVGAGAGGGLTVRALAAEGGSETHVLSTAELAAHTHGVTDGGHTHTLTDGGHTHTVTDGGHTHSATGNFVNDSVGSEYVNASGDKGTTQAATASATTGVTVDSGTTGATVDSGTTGVSVDSAGSGAAHENMPPFAVATAIIKT